MPDSFRFLYLTFYECLVGENILIVHNMLILLIYTPAKSFSVDWDLHKLDTMAYQHF